MQVPCPLPIVTLSSSTSSAAAAASKYDPADCLSEHLDYFSSDVVGQSNLMECDFDEIFGSLFHPSSATTVATPAADLTNVPCPLPKEVQTSAAQMPVSPLHSPSVSITSSNADEKSIIVSPAKVTFQTKIEPALLAPKPSVIVSSDEEEGGEDESIAPVEKKSDLRRKSFKRKNASPTSINIIPDKKRRRKDPTQQEESRRYVYKQCQVIIVFLVNSVSQNALLLFIVIVNAIACTPKRVVNVSVNSFKPWKNRCNLSKKKMKDYCKSWVCRAILIAKWSCNDKKKYKQLRPKFLFVVYKSPGIVSCMTKNFPTCEITFHRKQNFGQE